MLEEIAQLAAALAECDEALKKAEDALDERNKTIMDLTHRIGNVLAVAAAAIRLHDKDGARIKAEALDRIYEIADKGL